MRAIRLIGPKTVVFGEHCAAQCVDDILALGVKRVFVVTSPPVAPLAQPLVRGLEVGGASVVLYGEIATEPTVEMFEEAREAARAAAADAVVGIGGGSALDVAKLVAALYAGPQDVRQALSGERPVPPRQRFLACLPTTTGTGSEVSPNAILLDKQDRLKKAVVSAHLVPDAAYVDPTLTLSLPGPVTAATGMDALTHCIEAYANRFAHPTVDLYALRGIELIGANLARAVENGQDIEARTNMALGSLYGGLCLGPVGTGAVHALAYPLGGEFHTARGVSNAVLLAPVIEFNLPAAPERYAEIAVALGVPRGATPNDTAQAGLARIRELGQRCGIPKGLSGLGVPAGAIAGMAVSAVQITRLMRNNPRDMTAADAEAIYRAAYQ